MGRRVSLRDPFRFGFGTGFQDIDQLIDSMFKTAESLDSTSDPNSVYYGYQVNVGPDGKPHVREFGNVKPTRRGTFGSIRESRSSMSWLMRKTSL